MSAIIKTLKTTTNDVEQSVYPKTVLEAVVDAETNETLDVILDNLNEKIDNIEPGGGSSEIPTDVQEQIDGKVSKSGDTMTGDLTVKANINVPLSRDNTGYTLVPIPTAGTIQLSDSTQGITDVLTSYKSFMGSIYAKNAWNNIISTRHRNGTSDGVSHGMYLRSLMNNETPNLTWAVQAAGIWQSERAILDSGNYSTEIPSATQSAVGLMSAADKKKLDGIATGANAYSLPQAGSTLGGVKTTSKVTSTSGLTACPIISGVPYYKDTNTTYNLSSFGITATAAELNYTDGVTSNIQTQLNNKAASSHTHSSYLPLAGGTMKGAITLTDNYGIKAANGSHILTVSSATVTPTSVMASKKPIYIGFADTSYVTYLRGTFIYLDCPYSPVTSKAWTTSSDERIKMNSELLDDEDKYITFFDNLKPRNYNYVRDEEGANKTIGFYAQEVEEALLAAGLSNEDFAGLNIIEDYEEGLGLGKDEAVYYKQFYTLSYEQFIPIIVNKIQNMEKVFNDRIAVLEKKIEELTGGTK